MAAKKGNNYNPKGRSVGSKNKVTSRAQAAISRVVEMNVDKFSQWLEEIYKEHGAKEAWKCLEGIIEYHVPKLQRSEITQSTRVVDKDGNDILREDREILERMGILKERENERDRAKTIN